MDDGVKDYIELPIRISRDIISNHLNLLKYLKEGTQIDVMMLLNSNGPIIGNDISNIYAEALVISVPIEMKKE